MEDMNQIINTRLQHLLASINRINQLLLSDQSIFSKNELAEINNSNSDKEQLLMQLQKDVLDLHALIPVRADGEKPTLSQYIQSLEQSKANHLSTMLESLYQALATGYQHLMLNNDIVTENLQFMNKIWERLAHIANQETGTYEKPLKK
jgi:hypothetical protein